MRTRRCSTRSLAAGTLAFALACAGSYAQVGAAPGVGPPAPAPARSDGRTLADILLSPGRDLQTGLSSQSPAPAHASDEPSLRSDAESRPLGRAPETPTERAIAPAPGNASVTDGWIGRTILALALVVGLALVTRSLVRRVCASSGGLSTQLGAGGRAPSGVLLVLGRYPIARAQTLVLLKVDRRVLLLSQSSAGFQALCEITDPEEVASLLIKTRDEAGESLTRRFSALLRRVESDPNISGESPPALPDARLVGPRNDSWPARQRWGDADDRAADPVVALRRRLQSLGGSAPR